MEDKITALALEAGLLNYVDNETPRRYFVHGFADVEDVEQFAKLIVLEVLSYQESLVSEGHNAWHLNDQTKKHFGVEE